MIVLAMESYFRPLSLPDALTALTMRAPLVPLAGGADFYPARVVQAPNESVLDISGLPHLRQIERRTDHWWIPCLASTAGTRTLRLEDFILGPRKTARRPDELGLGLHIPCTHDVAQSVFLKLGSRRYLVISIVMLAAVITRAVDGRITRARIAVGACAATAKRLPALEAALIGVRGDTVTILDEHLAPLSPIDDIRAPAAYRRQTVSTLLRRAIKP
jgi:CO/xanthine dehydrogenase FAD-binding subunit